MKNCNECKNNTPVISEEGMRRKAEFCKKCGGCPQPFERLTPQKQPLGIMPEWLYEEQRMQELTEAIMRQLQSDSPDMSLISKWSDEISRRVTSLTRSDAN